MYRIDAILTMQVTGIQQASGVALELPGTDAEITPRQLSNARTLLPLNPAF